MACCLCVRSGEVVVVERFGKFNRIARPGFACLQPWCCEFSAGAMNMRIQQLDLRCETKTEDNVFVQICVAVQFAVEKTGDMSENGAYWRAFYRLDDPQTQIRSYVSSVLRAEVPTMKLDVVFQEKERIAKAIKESLTASLSEYGYMVLATLVTDIDPDPRVKQAMNEINASQRLRVAAMEKAEADKVRAALLHTIVALLHTIVVISSSSSPCRGRGRRGATDLRPPGRSASSRRRRPTATASTSRGWA